MKKKVWIIFILMFILCLFGCNEIDYATLNEVLGFDKEEVTKIKYSIKYEENDVMYNAVVNDIINKLDVEYSRLEGTTKIKPQNATHKFYIYSKEKSVSFSWLQDKRVLFSNEEWYYFSKEAIDLLDVSNLEFRETILVQGSFQNGYEILKILDSLYWEPIDKINNMNVSKEHLLSANRIITKGIKDTIWIEGHQCLISYFVNFEMGLVYMTSADTFTSIYDLYAFITQKQRDMIKSQIGIDA